MGSRGIGQKTREGDKVTPIGTFEFSEVYYRPDKVKYLKTCLPLKKINKGEFMHKRFFSILVVFFITACASSGGTGPQYQYQNKVNLDDDIWVSGNIGESKIGLEIIRKNITIDKNLREYFINKYLYPKPCKLGPNLALYSSSIVDVSDGFIGDLKKMLNDKYGALISLNKIPLSIKAKKLIFDLKKIKLEHVLNSGDDYSLIIVSNKKYRKKIKNIANKNKVKISRVGKVVLEKGVQFDSYINNNIIKEYDHFS